MPVSAVNNYTVETYATLELFQADAERLFGLGWALTGFAFQGTSIVAVYRRQQVVSV